MADPEELLEGLGEESPPPEIVLAAVRLFRYRAIAVAAIVVAVVVSGALVFQQVNVNSQFPVKVATARVTGGSYSGDGVGEFRMVGDISVVIWEVYGTGGANPDTFYVHAIGWDPQGRQLSIEVRDIRYGGRPSRLSGWADGSSWDSTTLLDLWFGAAVQGGVGPLAFDIQLVRYAPDGSRDVVGTVPFELGI
jgi:hypothetical protein